MQRALPCLLLAGATFATVPNTFSAGRSVVAREVNENFAYLDSSVAKKADSSTSAKALSDTAKAVRQGNLSTSGGTVSGPVVIKHNLEIDGGGVVQIRNSGGLYSSFAQIRDTLQLSKLAGTGSRIVVANSNGTLTTGIDASTIVTGGPYLLAKSASTQSLTGNIDWTNSTTSNLPNHYYSNLWSDSTNVFVHYYPAGSNETRKTITNGNLRVWNGTGINTLFIGGDGTLKWYSQKGNSTLAHSGNLDELGVMQAKGGTITGDLRISGNLTTTPHQPVADYVFEPDYKLTSLSEVEAYTKEHKHLPEVPSATEIGKSGLDLAQMNLVLLKKVEELTLHAIEQQKDLREQSRTNAEQKREIAELRAMIESIKPR